MSAETVQKWTHQLEMLFSLHSYAAFQEQPGISPQKFKNSKNAQKHVIFEIVASKIVQVSALSLFLQKLNLSYFTL